MCGIVGYTGEKEASPVLLEGLKRLEYRGYDSAGLAVRNGAGLTEVVKATGKLSHKTVFQGGQAKDVHHFVKHVLNELHGRLVTGAEHIVRHAPATPHLVWSTRATQPRIRCQSRLHVTGQVDFRDDVNMTLSGILYKVAELLLGIKATIADGVINPTVATDNGAVAISTHLGKFRVFLDFDTPTLVLAEMEMKLVHVVQG